MPEKVDLVNSAKAILSERASEFDAYSAYGEVVDNSIEAEAKNIKIRFDISLDRGRSKNFKKINKIIFGDDGIGMDKATLHHCLQLGYSSRYGNRKGIGRFGVGMTKAAIHECKKVEIYSKTSESANWNYVYIDIDEIIETEDSSIKEPIIKSLPNELSNYTDENKGTVVIWSKYDRQDKSADIIIEETKVWIGRTFRKFIFENRKIFINGEEIKAIDPLYINTEFTKFPDDPKAIQWGETDELKWPIDDPDLLDSDGPKESTIKIVFSLLPKEFLKPGRRIAGDTPDNKARYIDRNEGISILRNNREVRAPEDHIPYWKPQFKEVDRWWGCEIQFNAELDNWFQVHNIKRGAQPLKELREALQDKINNVRHTLVKEVQKYWDTLEKPELPPEDLKDDLKHGKSQKIVKDTVKETKPEDKAGTGKDPDKEIKVFVETSFANLTPEKQKAFIDYFKKNMITILEQPSNAPNFFEVVHFGDGKKNVSYNTKHVFFERYFTILNHLKDNNNTENYQEEILVLIDLLVVAFSLAESEFDREANLRAGDFFEDLMTSWGKHLRNLFNTWIANETKN
jgi:hypothetical protein